MKAMVLAAGKGTRLFPLTGELPKPLVPVADKPIIQYIFELLAASGIAETHANICYLADHLLDFYGHRPRVEGMPVVFNREERLLGTAGGARSMAANSGGFDETFVMLMGDALTDVRLDEVVGFHREKGALATLALVRVRDTSGYGVVELDARGNIAGFQEKPSPWDARSNLASTGIYVFEPEVLDYIPEGEFYDFAEDVFPRLLAAGERIVGYEGGFYWSDVGTLPAYRQAQRDVVNGLVDVRVSGERIGERLWAGQGARLHPTARLRGDVILGREAVVESRVRIEGATTIGGGCRVSPDAVIKRSILLPGASVGEGAYLEDCILGPGYTVGGGYRARRTELFLGAS